MEEKSKLLVNSCDFIGVKPVMADLPYPPIQVKEKNRIYANLLSIDYCGAVSEMTAITQYINNENRLSCERCPVARTILGIAMAEMIHLQKLAELIFLLGGSIDFVARHQDGRQRMWTPEYEEKMLMADIEAEKATINQYRMHMKMISDSCVNAVLARIIQDEEYHIMLLQMLRK